MNLALPILIAFVLAFAAGFPQDISEPQLLSPEIDIENRNLGEILKKACEYKWACDKACGWFSQVCPFCQMCDMA